MIEFLSNWFKRNFSDPQVVILALLLVAGFAIVIFMGRMLAPVLASVVIAYLLEGLTGLLERRRIPRLVAVLGVFGVFMVFLLFILLGLMPPLSRQLSGLIQELPNMVSQGQQALLRLPQMYPDTISAEQLREIMVAVRQEVASFGQNVLAFSLSSIPVLISLLVFLILVPFLVFFFMKDKQLILGWLTQYLPHERRLTARVWEEVDDQIGNYVRGKFWEIVIVGIVTYVVFAVMGLQYAILLAALVGLSVVIPYIGAAVVTVPVALVAYWQWGWGSDFVYLMVAYLVVQALDGNVLVPLLFSEAVNLHPVAIIVAVLVFGGLWGFWGVFFAIPLATLVKAVLSAWPSAQPAPVGSSD